MTDRERRGLLDAAWALTLALGLLAVGVPWFLRVLPIELGPPAWAAFAYAFAHFGLSAWIENWPSARARRVASRFREAAGFAFLGVLWHLVGGVHHPLFLAAFVPPTLANLARGAGLGYGAAALSIVVPWTVAVAEAPDLRLYLFQLGLPVGGLLRLLPPSLPATAAPFPGLADQPAYLSAALAAYSVLQVATALVARRLIAGIEQRADQARAVAEAQGELDSLFREALRTTAQPTALVYADSGRILDVSGTFQQQMLLHGQPLAGRDLFELVQFSDETSVRLLLETGGESRFCAYSVGPEARLAHLQVESFRYGGAVFASVRFQEATELYHLEAAWRAAEQALLVIGPDGRLCYANPAAQQLFGELCFGLPAADVLAQPGVPERWWTPGALEDGARVRLGTGAYAVSAATIATEGAAHPLLLVRLERATQA